MAIKKLNSPKDRASNSASQVKPIKKLSIKIGGVKNAPTPAEKSAKILQENAAIDEANKAKIAAFKLSSRTKETTESTPIVVPESMAENLPAVAANKLTAIPTTANAEIILNEKQLQAIDMAGSGRSFCLIGGAGTGKTTSQEQVCIRLNDSGKIYPLPTGSKHLAIGQPSVLICSFTNKATENIRARVPREFRQCCNTIHKTIEFAPTKYTEYDNDLGVEVVKQKFEPQRNEENPLPPLSVIIIEEASTVGIGLFLKLVEALPERCVFIFLGDLNQLTPVMDDAILGYALNHLPTVELTEPHRAALDSPITRFAYKILEGRPLKNADIDALGEEYAPEKLRFIPFKTTKKPEQEMMALGETFKQSVVAGKFDPTNTVVLCPYNVGGHINVDNLNRYIAQGFTEITGNPIYEIISGFNTFYYSVGDIVFSGKELWEIERIESNPKYIGKPPRLPTVAIDRWGRFDKAKAESSDEFFASLTTMEGNWEDSNISTEELIHTDEDEENARKSNASHVVTLKPVVKTGTMLDPEEEMKRKVLVVKGDYSDTMHGYALSVHKSQGSEWRKVFCVFHDSHARMLVRENLYTSVTRAKEELVIIYRRECKNETGRVIPNTFTIGIRNQEIKGKTLKDKLKFFQDKEAKEKKKLEVRARVLAKADPSLSEEEHFAQLWEDSNIRKIIEFFEDLKIEAA